LQFAAASRPRFRTEFATSAQSWRPAQKRSYDCDVRKASSTPSTVPLSECSAMGMGVTCLSPSVVKSGRKSAAPATTQPRSSGKRASTEFAARALASCRDAARGPSAACGLCAQATTQANSAVATRRPRIAAKVRDPKLSSRFWNHVSGS